MNSMCSKQILTVSEKKVIDSQKNFHIIEEVKNEILVPFQVTSAMNSGCRKGSELFVQTKQAMAECTTYSGFMTVPNNLFKSTFNQSLKPLHLKPEQNSH